MEGQHSTSVNVGHTPTSTSVNVGKTATITILGKYLDGKKIRVFGEEYLCRYTANKKLLVDDKDWTIFKSEKRIPDREMMTLVEVWMETFGWIMLETLTSTAGKPLPPYLFNAKHILLEHRITTLSEFHNHPLFEYKTKKDIVTDKQIPLLRVCDSLPNGDMFRVSLSNDSSLLRYVEQMCTHVKHGGRTAKLPFFSASTNTEVIRYYSCGFLRHVIWIDQSKIKHRAFEIGGLPGRTLLGLSDSNMLQNFADASEEVLIADTILASHYSVAKVQFDEDRNIRELYIDQSLKGKFPTMTELMNDYKQEKLGEGVLKFTDKRDSQKAFVVKVGRYKGMGANNHILNEFFTSFFYSALGVDVPNTILRACRINVTCEPEGAQPFEVYTGEIYYLIHEFIDGDSPNFESRDHVELVARGCFADILLANFDVLGKNQLANLKVKNGKVYRIDCGAGLFTKHDGEPKDFAMNKRKFADVRKDVIKYFTIDTMQTKKVWIQMSEIKLFGCAKNSVTNFWDRVTKFRNAINSKSAIPYFWDELLGLVSNRLATLVDIEKRDISRRVWQLIRGKVESSGETLLIEDIDTDMIDLEQPRSVAPTMKPLSASANALFSKLSLKAADATVAPTSNLKTFDFSFSNPDRPPEFEAFFPQFYFKVDGTTSGGFRRNEHLNFLYKEHIQTNRDCVNIIETIVDELQNSAANVELIGATGHNHWCHVLAIQDIVRNELAADRKLSSSRPQSVPIKPVRKQNRITIQGTKCKLEESRYVINLTSNGGDVNLRKLSPFQPFHDGHLPAFHLPAIFDRRSFTVEGMWQGLKMIKDPENGEGKCDFNKFTIQNGRNLKRRGVVLGHFAGEGKPMLGYIEARKQIYIPLYTEMLNKYCQAELNELFERYLEHDLIFLDYFVNDDVEQTSTPLSHASLVKARLEEMFKNRFDALPVFESNESTDHKKEGKKKQKGVQKEADKDGRLEELALQLEPIGEDRHIKRNRIDAEFSEEHEDDGEPNRRQAYSLQVVRENLMEKKPVLKEHLLLAAKDLNIPSVQKSMGKKEIKALVVHALVTEKA